MTRRTLCCSRQTTSAAPATMITGVRPMRIEKMSSWLIGPWSLALPRGQHQNLSVDDFFSAPKGPAVDGTHWAIATRDPPRRHAENVRARPTNARSVGETSRSHVHSECGASDVLAKGHGACSRLTAPGGTDGEDRRTLDAIGDPHPEGASPSPEDILRDARHRSHALRGGGD